ncbi:MAG: extracellular solute-binding protein, partial [Anaerolineae bacterium]|nr:extracellular solute-binding protein [Anaerolineae bacterium]
WGGSIASPFIDAGQVLELTPYYDQYGWHKLFAPWAVAAISRRGGVYGVPRCAYGMGLWYRKDLFDKYELSVPKTYADLEAICVTLKKNGIYAGTVGGKYGWHTMRLLDYFIEHAAGPELHNKLNNLEVSWDIPEVVEAYRLLKRWVDNQWLVPDFLTIDPGDARWPWYKGEAAMILEGIWMEGVIKGDQQDLGKFDFFLPPTDHEPLRYSAFPEQTMIAKASKHPDETALLLNYLSVPETQKRHLDLFVNSATAGVTPNCDEWPLTCRWREIVLTSRDTYPPTDQAFVKELMDGYFEVQDGVVAGKLTPEEAAKTLQQRVEEWKAKNQ